jgi:hypothetical protein
MGWTIILEDENGQAISTIPKEFNYDEIDKQVFDSFMLLKYIDCYGYTTFNTLQLGDLQDDFEKLKALTTTQKDIINQILDLIKEGQNKVHAYVKFYTQYENLIKKAYSAFNGRDIDTALSTMHPDVQWPKAFEGGYVKGHDEIREYWTRQWTEINPIVLPIVIYERQDGTLEITVHQKVKDLQGNTIFDGIVKHIYTLQDGLLRRMDIET